MVRKRFRTASLNGIVTGESSESDGSQKQDKIQNNLKNCNHASKSVNRNVVRKNLHLEDITNNNFCPQCTKLGASQKGDEIYVCLQCGAKACSLDHSKVHNEKPRSESHNLSMNLSERTVWCHACQEFIDVSQNRKLKDCVNNVENMHEKHLSKPVKASPRIESIAEESSAENSLQAVPVLSPKAGSPSFGLKCLAQTPNLIETLREMMTSKDVCIELSDGKKLTGCLEMQDHLCEELAETLTKIRGAGPPFSPQKVLNTLRKRVPQFRGSDQHDSHELLRHLLDTVRCSDLKRYRKIMLNKLGLNGVDTDKVDVEKQKELKLLDREVTDKVMLVPDQVFRGFLVSRLECQECKHSSECVESFLDLSLPVSSEKPHPPSFRRKPVEEKGGSQISKHQLKKERRLERKKKRGHHGPHLKKNDGLGETVPSISEKGESDAEGDEGDVDSEESDRKTEPGLEDSQNDVLCAGIPINAEKLSRFNMLSFERTISYEGTKSRGFIRDRISDIHLTDEGVPDISKLSLNGSTQHEIKPYMRDSCTIAKEEPEWLSRVHEPLYIPADRDSPLLNTSNINSPSPENTNEVQRGKSEKEEEISSDDKTIVGENSEKGHEWLHEEESQHSAELSIWDETAPPAVPPALPQPYAHVTSTNDDAANSDEDVSFGSLFEEGSHADSSAECTIQSCLSQFTGIEMMTGSNKVGCETCTARANKGKKDGKTVYTISTKQLLISEAPPVLILHIKRFQVQMSSFRKLSRHVAFPLELDVSSFCKVDTANNTPRRSLYSLYGIVEHSGNFSGGHYVAYVKVENNWFCVSDSYVHEVKESRVLQAQAYLLFYKSLWEETFSLDYST